MLQHYHKSLPWEHYLKKKSQKKWAALEHIAASLPELLDFCPPKRTWTWAVKKDSPRCAETSKVVLAFSFYFFPCGVVRHTVFNVQLPLQSGEIFKHLCIRLMIQRFIYKTVDFGTPNSRISTAAVSHVRGR